MTHQQMRSSMLHAGSHTLSPERACVRWRSCRAPCQHHRRRRRRRWRKRQRRWWATASKHRRGRRLRTEPPPPPATSPPALPSLMSLCHQRSLLPVALLLALMLLPLEELEEESATAAQASSLQRKHRRRRCPNGSFRVFACSRFSEEPPPWLALDWLCEMTSLHCSTIDFCSLSPCWPLSEAAWRGAGRCSPWQEQEQTSLWPARRSLLLLAQSSRPAA